MPPIVGAYYRSALGPIVQIEAVNGPRWLARFVFSPLEANRANHRQWLPYWEAQLFTQVPPQENVGGECTCGGCLEGKISGRWLRMSDEPKCELCGGDLDIKATMIGCQKCGTVWGRCNGAWVEVGESDAR